ncbi:hypothetical protein GBF35_49105 [Nonomuraea phyllanthi]|uniref:hypothetical protein n=1 Tax=Nonomuraea phyllanthi TaxID=2219224 RepID=UPI0012933D1D|nr:hypothetical protein [Nonomuraea phyllanthi]QFY13473.1 hypothetical protein GBF35_49105 [Nonomuraea phyllanthi]
MHTLVKGLIAGAAGTSALNIATYLDMAIRARAASSTPQQAVEKLTDLTDVDLGDDEQADHRKQALAALGTTDPRQWSASAWISDAVPHLAYGITAYAAFALLRT